MIVVGDFYFDFCVVVVDGDLCVLRVGVLGYVGQCFLHDLVGGEIDVGG